MRRLTVRELFVIVIAVAAGAAAAGGCSPSPTGSTPTDTTHHTDTVPKAIPVVFAGGTVKAELATTGTQRNTGLSNRTSIAADSGMIFVFGVEHTPAGCAFWMQDTHFDLDIAFLASDKRVINTDTMTKDTQDLHMPTANCRYAIEAPKGWFAAHGVTAGAQATFTIPAGVVIDP